MSIKEVILKESVFASSVLGSMRFLHLNLRSKSNYLESKLLQPAQIVPRFDPASPPVEQRAVGLHAGRRSREVGVVVGDLDAAVSAAGYSRSAAGATWLVGEEAYPHAFRRCVCDTAEREVLRQVMEKDGRTLKGYRRVAAKWPPPKKFLNAKPIGLAYHVQNLFRLYLKRHIEQKMTELEARGDMMQLDTFSIMIPGGFVGRFERLIPQLGGAYTDQKGQGWAADTDLVNAPLDIGSMNLQWVSETSDPLFASLSKAQRRLLYMVFAQDMTWSNIARSTRQNVKTVRVEFDAIMSDLRRRVGMACAQ